MILSKFQYNQYINEDKLGLNVKDRELPDSLLKKHEYLDRDLASFQVTLSEWIQLYVSTLCIDMQTLAE